MGIPSAIYDEVIEKARAKNDGVYAHKGVYYRVRKNSVTHMCHWGNAYIRAYGFLVDAGRLENHYEGAAKKWLKSIKD
jgi:hypothetical protein